MDFDPFAGQLPYRDKTCTLQYVFRVVLVPAQAQGECPEPRQAYPRQFAHWQFQGAQVG
jgi:hypothetical protein